MNSSSDSKNPPGDGAPVPARSQPPIQAGQPYVWWEHPIDVDAKLKRRAASGAGALHWKDSIVDLLKLLDQDFDPEAIKKLALDLGWPREKLDDVQDRNAAMNAWLCKTVRLKLAESGSKMPQALP